MEGRVGQVAAIRVDARTLPAVAVIPAAFLHDEGAASVSGPHPITPGSFHSPPPPLVLRV